MKVGQYLWLAFLAFFVALVVFGVVNNVYGIRDFPKQQLDSFLNRPLIGQILIGFVGWLISLIAGFVIFGYWIEYQAKRGAEIWFGWLALYFIFWPPAWPIAVILFPVLWIINKCRRPGE